MRMIEADYRNRGEGHVFFPGGNTRYGFHSFFEHIAGSAAKSVYILKGGPGVGKSTFMNHIAREMTEQGYAVEHHICASDTGSTDAVHFPEIGVAVMDGTSPHTMDPQNPGVTDQIINLGEYWDASTLQASQEAIETISRETAAHFAAAFAHLGGAGTCLQTRDHLLLTHSFVDMDAVTRQVDEMMDFILSCERREDHAPHLSRERHLFLSGVTPQGTVTGVGRLSESADACWVIEDDTSLISDLAVKQALNLARMKQMKCWVFHCGLDPEKLEHCFFPDLGLCIVTVQTGTAQYVSNKAGLLQNASSADRLSRALSSTAMELHNAAESALHRAISELSEAKASHRRLEDYYVPAMDFSLVDARRTRVVEEILNG